MSFVNKITSDDYVSYTMRLVEPSNTTGSLANIVIQEHDGVEEVFTIRYTDNSSSRGGDEMTVMRGIIPYDGNEGDGTGDTSGGGTVSVFVCNSVGEVVEVLCTGDDHHVGESCDCGNPGNSCTEAYYTILWTEDCNWEYQDGNGNTVPTSPNDPPPGGGAPPPTDPDEIITKKVEFQIPEDEFLPLVQCIEPNDSQLIWLNEQKYLEGSNDLATIWGYVNSYDTDDCDEKRPFLQEAIDAFDNDFEVDFEKLIVYQPSFKDTETKCIHDKLISDDSNNFYKLMANSFSDGDEMLNYKIAPLPVGVGGETQGHIANNNSNGFDFYQITISSDTENQSNIVQMVTLSHELIHAYMYDSLDDMGIIIYDENGGVWFNREQCNEYQPNVDINTLSQQDRWLALICAYNTNNPDSDDWTHDLFSTATFIVETYRSELENLILNKHDWDNETLALKTFLQSEFGSNWKEKAAEYISWKGLEKTDQFITWAQNNNLEGNNTNGNITYPAFNAIYVTMESFGKSNCN